MTQFVQIGYLAFNPSHIQEIQFGPDGEITIYWHEPVSPGGDYEHTRLTSVQAEHFRNWWANKADVFAA
jgi:hypothetical protein